MACGHRRTCDQVFDAAVIGRAVWDSWLDVPSVAQESHSIFFGGPGANVAVHLAGLGLRCTLLTVFGDDRFSDEYRSYLQNRNVDISLGRTVRRPLPKCEMWLGQRRRYRWVDDYEGLDVLTDLRLDRVKSLTDTVFFADFPLDALRDEFLTETCYCAPGPSLAGSVRSVNKLVSLPWRVVFLNRSEAGFCEAHLGADLALVSTRGVSRTWIVTRGTEPTILFENGRVSEFPVAETDCVSSVGGGDAFAAGVVAALHRGYDVGGAINVGQAAARIIVQEIGCQSSRLTWSAVARGSRRKGIKNAGLSEAPG